MSVEEGGRDPVEVILPSTEEAAIPAIKHADALRALMEFYESAEAGDEDENEVDLMIQLSGMTNINTQGDD
jgi:hypothetical protein